MQIGIDSFAANPHFGNEDTGENRAQAMGHLLDRMQYADEVGLDVFGIGEHHRGEYMDSANHMILSAAASRTKNIRLASTVKVLSADDPVRVFQNYATLDLISQGRAEIVAGRGSFTEAFPLFGLNMHAYDEIFAEKLELLLHIRENEVVTWSGQFRPALKDQAIFPRPMQDPLPIWLGVGGTPGSFVRAGMLGLPLMVAIIGGATRRFRPLVDLYRQAWVDAGHPPEEMKVGLHSLGYVAETTEQAHAEYFPGYQKSFTKIGRERGWGPVTRAQYDAQVGKDGALLVGGPEEIAEKVLRHSEALGGIDRLSFHMVHPDAPQENLMRSIELIGTRVAPIVREATSEGVVA
jgi:probable LLM family oxidoreductase